MGKPSEAIKVRPHCRHVLFRHVPAARSPHQLPAARSRQRWLRWPRTTGLAAGLLATAAAVLTPGRADALLVFTIRQVGNDVVVSGGGKYSNSGLFLEANPPPDFPDPPNADIPNIYPSNPFGIDNGGAINGAYPFIISGVSPSANPTAYLWKVNFLNSPGAFGGNQDTMADTGSGPAFGVDQGYQDVLGYSYLILPSNVVCTLESPCEALGSISTYQNTTIANLGLTPGIYTWKWGAGGINETFQLNIEAPGPLPALGAASAFAWSRKLRRRIKGCSTHRAAPAS